MDKARGKLSQLFSKYWGKKSKRKQTNVINYNLFVEDGVFQQCVEDVSADDFAPFLWAFVDADACSLGVPENLLADTNIYIMFTDSEELDGRP